MMYVLLGYPIKRTNVPRLCAEKNVVSSGGNKPSFITTFSVRFERNLKQELTKRAYPQVLVSGTKRLQELCTHIHIRD
jgi:hypothetical protein